MNTGAFGENFPYSNFHDLNTDWIIKIAKDFLDQYTHIQEIISTGEESLQNLTTEGLEQLQAKADALEALLQEWYNTHSQDIANQLADALSDLENWYTTHEGYLNQYLSNSIAAFNQAADQKATETIASIPADYTTLAQNVNRLDTALSGYYVKSHSVNLGTAEAWADYNSNFNDLTANEFYSIWYSTGIQNAPYDGFLGNVLVATPFSVSNPVSISQIAIPFDSSKIYVRQKLASTWRSEWVIYPSLTEALRTVNETYIVHLQEYDDYNDWWKDYIFSPGKNLINIHDIPNIKTEAYVSASGVLNQQTRYNCIAFKLDNIHTVLSCSNPGVYIGFFPDYSYGKLSTETIGVIIPDIISMHITTADESTWTNIPIPTNAKWVIASCDNQLWEAFQIEYGSTKTAYESYKKILNPIVNIPKATIVNVSNYTNLRACLESITPSENNPFIVEIPDGEYDIQSYYTTEEIASSNFKGLFVPNYTTLRGIGSRERTVLKWEKLSGDADNRISTLNIYDVADLENLTIVATNIRYCVHDDFATSYDSINIRNVKNCIFRKSNSGYKSVYGAGMKGNAQWKFENCVFEGNSSMMSGFSVHNNRNVHKDSNIYLINCRFVNEDVSNKEIAIENMTNDSTGITYVYLIGCQFEQQNAKILVSESNPTSYGAGILTDISGYGNSFNNNNINIVSTDGVDYSNRKNLVP